MQAKPSRIRKALGADAAGQGGGEKATPGKGNSAGNVSLSVGADEGPDTSNAEDEGPGRGRTGRQASGMVEDVDVRQVMRHGSMHVTVEEI